VGLLPVIVWLKGCGRRLWLVLAVLSGALSLLSLWCLAAATLTQIQPSQQGMLGSVALILHILVALLVLFALIHALTGIGRPPREARPMRGLRLKLTTDKR
jgi:predicted Co/Zn/Cd cation transporter (cation efflux family)